LELNTYEEEFRRLTTTNNQQAKDDDVLFFIPGQTFKHSKNIDNSALIYHYHILKSCFAHLQE